jgi:endonuclease-3
VPDLKARAREVNARLAKRHPDAKGSLDFNSPFELLIATILAAQSTDARVNIVTKSLFRKYPNPQAFATAEQVEMEKDVRQTGFFRNKAKAVIACAQAIVERHGGEVPASMDDLVKLPGVGRKTANVVLGNAFRVNVGIAVDTHVLRVSGRLGLTAHADAEKIEQDLMKLLPESEWTTFTHRVIYHGRETCIARKPLCEACVLNDICPSRDLAAVDRVAAKPAKAGRSSRPASTARSARSATPPSKSPSRTRASRSKPARKPSR